MSELNWAEIREQTLGDFTLAALPPTLELPALPHAVTLFTQKAGDESVSIKELAEIIETDSGLTLELLKHVNSAFVGMRHKSTSVQQALSMLGRRQSKTLIVTTGMQAAIRSRKSKLINQNCFWSAGLQKAIFAREVAKLLQADGDVAFSGALLQDFLLPVVTNDLFDNYINFVENRDDYPPCMTGFETATLGFDHAMAGAAMAHRWHLPDDLVCCILFHHFGLRILAHPELKRTAVAAVALSAMLPDQLRQQSDGLDLLLRLQEKWGKFNLHELAETVDAAHEEMGMGVKNDFPLSRRCAQLGGDDEAQFCDGSLKTASAT